MRNSQIQSDCIQNYMTNAQSHTFWLRMCVCVCVCDEARTAHKRWHSVASRKWSNPLKCRINKCEWFIATDDRFLTTINTYHLFVKWAQIQWKYRIYCKCYILTGRALCSHCRYRITHWIFGIRTQQTLLCVVCWQCSPSHLNGALF